MNIGHLRHRVTIQLPTTTSTAAGNVRTWANVANANVWCRIRPLTASERYNRDHQELAVTHEVKMRGRPDATALWRLVYGGRYLYVKSVIQTDERGIETVLLCEERT